MDLLKKEYAILSLLINRTKKEHKNSLIFKKLKHLSKLKQPDKIKNCAMDLYILASSNFDQKHYLGFTYVIMGISARIWYLTKENLDEIDDIFG